MGGTGNGLRECSQSVRRFARRGEDTGLKPWDGIFVKAVPETHEAKALIVGLGSDWKKGKEAAEEKTFWGHI